MGDICAAPSELLPAYAVVVGRRGPTLPLAAGPDRGDDVSGFLPGELGVRGWGRWCGRSPLRGLSLVWQRRWWRQGDTCGCRRPTRCVERGLWIGRKLHEALRHAMLCVCSLQERGLQVVRDIDLVFH